MNRRQPNQDVFRNDLREEGTWKKGHQSQNLNESMQIRQLTQEELAKNAQKSQIQKLFALNNDLFIEKPLSAKKTSFPLLPNKNPVISDFELRSKFRVFQKQSQLKSEASKQIQVDVNKLQSKQSFRQSRTYSLLQDNDNDVNNKLKKADQILEKFGFFQLFQDLTQDFLIFLQDICRNIEVYTYQNEEILLKLMRRLQLIFFSNKKCLQVLYPQIDQAIKCISKYLEQQSIWNIFENYRDYCLKNTNWDQQKIRKVFTQQFAFQNLITLHESDVVNLHQINDVMSMLGQAKFQLRILNILNQQNYCQFSKSVVNRLFKLINFSSIQLMQNIRPQNDIQLNQKQKVSFTYLNNNKQFTKNQKIQRDLVKQLPLVIFDSILELDKYQSKFLSAIFTFLSRKGGLVLLDINQNKEQLLVDGSQMTEATQKTHKQRIMSYFHKIQPSLTKQMINIDFVPILKNEINIDYGNIKEGDLDENDQNLNQRSPFLMGLYVTRIKINATSSQIIYFKQEAEFHLLGQQQFQNNSSLLQSGLQQSKSSGQFEELYQRLLRERTSQGEVQEK